MNKNYHPFIWISTMKFIWYKLWLTFYVDYRIACLNHVSSCLWAVFNTRFSYYEKNMFIFDNHVSTNVLSHVFIMSAWWMKSIRWADTCIHKHIYVCMQASMYMLRWTNHALVWFIFHTCKLNVQQNLNHCYYSYVSYCYYQYRYHHCC